MVLLTAYKRINQWLGPNLLKFGLKARSRFRPGNNPSLDSVLLLPIAQKIIQIEAREEMIRLRNKNQDWRDFLFNGLDVNVDNASFMSIFKSKEKKIVDKKNDNIDVDELSTMRVKVLESYLRPVLVPNEKWSDVDTWRFNPYFMQWLRAEYLHARFGLQVSIGLQAYNKLSKCAQLQSRHRYNKWTVTPKVDLSILPMTSTVRDALDTRDYSYLKDRKNERKRIRQLVSKVDGEYLEFLNGAIVAADAPDDASLERLSFEDIVEVTGGLVHYCGPLNALCEYGNLYQIWTQEYIDRLGAYLLSRASRMPQLDTVILDVGAGDGLLAAYLREYVFQKLSSLSVPIKSSKKRPLLAKKKILDKSVQRSDSTTLPLTIIATDNGAEKIEKKAEVEKLSVQETMKRYATDTSKNVIVICSWMPMNEDWTATFRQYNVSEYILIGEADDGQCGNMLETWGNNSIDDDDNEATPSSTKPRHQVEGYARKELTDLLPFQLSRYDTRPSKNGTTVSFRRI